MDLINWSLNAIDTIFSTRSLGSGEPDCPAGTFAAGYTMDAWERWRVVCLAALSVEDIEDIYLFGTMITGLLLIGLGFALVYREIQKTVTAAQNPTRLPVMIEAVGRAVSIETGTINRKMDNIMEKLTALQSTGLPRPLLEQQLPRMSTEVRRSCVPPPNPTDNLLIVDYVWDLIKVVSMATCCVSL
ncbi:hypothetical protein DPX16_23144 [Anabarilius grahami]|uniref:Uncharacterized protein n=1 Tax=Anabarilius grahami TaxID=495550 RepID=A0A3N0XKH6_ANAGA|nr:hypothetical protein DPX16_23144 [Anabarilius grahami]